MKEFLQIKAGDLMEGGKPPRDCRQSIRPYNVFFILRRGDQWSPAFVSDNRLFSGRRGRRPLPRYNNRDSTCAIPLVAFIHSFSTFLADGVLVVPSRLREQKRIFMMRAARLSVSLE